MTFEHRAALLLFQTFSSILLLRRLMGSIADREFAELELQNCSLGLQLTW